MINQRRTMTRGEFENELTLLLMADVHGALEPDTSMLKKANTTIMQVMALVDKYKM